MHIEAHTYIFLYARMWNQGEGEVGYFCFALFSCLSIKCYFGHDLKIITGSTSTSGNPGLAYSNFTFRLAQIEPSYTLR